MTNLESRKDLYLRLTTEFYENSRINLPVFNDKYDLFYDVVYNVHLIWKVMSYFVDPLCQDTSFSNDYYRKKNCKLLRDYRPKKLVICGGFLPILCTFRSCFILLYSNKSTKIELISFRSVLYASPALLHWCLVGMESYNVHCEDLSIACTGGHLELVKAMGSFYIPYEWNSACFFAAKAGHLNILQWLRAQDPPCPWSDDACSVAAEYGHFEVLQWLRSEDPPCPWDDNVTYFAAKYGDLNTIKWMFELNAPIGYYICYVAAENDCLDVLKWLLEVCPPDSDNWDTLRAMNTCAIRTGDMELLNWFELHYPDFLDSEMCTFAAEVGQIEVLGWLRSRDPPCPWSVLACSRAVFTNQLLVLQWLRSQDPACPWDESLYESAINKYYVDGYINDAISKKKTLSCETEAGQATCFEILQWLRAQDPPCPWYLDGCIEAAENAHIQRLASLEKMDLHPESLKDFEKVCEIEHLEMLRWLQTNL